MDTLLEWVLAMVPSLLVGGVLAIFNARQKEREDRERDEERSRQKVAALNLSLLLASAKLSFAVAMAVQRGKPNGEIEEGVAQYNDALERFREFEREQITKL